MKTKYINGVAHPYGVIVKMFCNGERHKQGDIKIYHTEKMTKKHKDWYVKVIGRSYEEDAMLNGNIWTMTVEDL